jgi:hypothetical protein
MATADNIARTGMIESGNINLKTRRPVKTTDGQYATVRSMSFSDRNGVETLIPTVVNGRIVSDDKAIQHYYNTGEHLGKYTTPDAATKAAQRIHEAEAVRIAKIPMRVSLVGKR